MKAFDTVIVADWASGKSSGPTPRKDAIWICAASAKRVEAPIYFRSRMDAEAWLQERLASEVARGRRVLASFDFPFAYPAGFAHALMASPSVTVLLSRMLD